MSLEAIRQFNAAIERQYKGVQMLPYDGDSNYFHTIPHVGWKAKQGFIETATYFVDSSGVGKEDEPALTLKQFLQEVKEGCFYGVAEVGQFQVFIREFKSK